MQSSRIRLCDIGSNLLDPQFQGIYNDSLLHKPDLLNVLKRAEMVGVKNIILTASSAEDTRKAISLIKTINNSSSSSSPLVLKTSIGIHPLNSHLVDFSNNKWKQDLEEIGKEGMENNLICCVGECGLDRLRQEDGLAAPLEIQQKVWDFHFDLANFLKLPMFIHSRKCGEETIKSLKNKPLPAGGVVHSFDGSEEEMKQIVDLGFFIGINGCSLRSTENISVVKKLPLENLLIETDAPWCEVKKTHVGFDYLEEEKGKPIPHPVIDYQEGSLRDDFDFGEDIDYNNFDS